MLNEKALTIYILLLGHADKGKEQKGTEMKRNKNKDAKQSNHKVAIHFLLSGENSARKSLIWSPTISPSPLPSGFGLWGSHGLADP